MHVPEVVLFGFHFHFPFLLPEVSHKLPIRSSPKYKAATQHAMPSIILRKVFKEKDYSIANQKGLCFHGPAVSKTLIGHVNDALATIRITEDTNRPYFQWNKTEGHYYAFMNHNFQKRHEDDAIAEILDVMEAAGWKFQFQYDSGFSSSGLLGGESKTSNELWIFHKDPKSYEIYKESVDTKTGITLGSDPDTGKITVKGLVAGGLFEMTGIPEGAMVLSINNVPCRGKSVSDVIKSITSKQGTVTILTY